MPNQDRKDLLALVTVVERLGVQAQWGATAIEDENWISAGDLVERIRTRWEEESREKPPGP